MKKRVLNLVIGMVVAIGLPGCIQSHTVVLINKDGTATIEEKTMLGGMMAQMMAGLGDAFAQEGDKKASTNPLLDRASFEARAKKMGEGVTLTRFEEAKDDKGGIGVNVVYSVADINKLKLNMTAEVPESMKGMAPDIEKKLEGAKEEKEKLVSFSYKGGELIINLPQPDKADGGAAADNELEGLEPELKLGPEQKQQMEMAKMMLQDMAMSLTVKVNGEITKSNASHRRGNEITLFSMKFSEVLKDPDAFGKLALLGEDLQNQDKAMEAMKKLPGVTVETQEKVTVNIK